MDNLVSIGTLSKGSNDKPSEPPAKMNDGAEIIFFPGVRYERISAQSDGRSNEDNVSGR